MSAHQRLLGVPWVYDRLRLALLGGGPGSEVIGWLGDTREGVVIDIGCGTGLGFERLAGFREYHGYDTDARALRRFRRRPLPESVHLYNREATAEDLARIRPTKALLMGLMHHLPDDKAAALLAMLAQCPSLECAATLDPVLVEGKTINAILCRLDRGRFARSREAYERLVNASGLALARSEILQSGNRLAFYFCTLLRKNSP